MRFALLALLLSACTTMPTSQVPVAISCIPAVVPQPPQTLSNADLAKLDDRTLVLTIAAERLGLLDYSGQAAVLIAACR